jgi:chromosome partitioning protein
VAVLRDSQAYVRSAECGMGIHEMKGALLQEDLDTWKPLVDWLEHRSVSAPTGGGITLTPPPTVEAGEGARG